MTVERLAITSKEVYQPQEAAVHLARYLICKDLCKDKTVLDMACGVGYGTNLMGNYWGAKQAIGVDISSEAIEVAQREFSSDNTAFFCTSIETATNCLPEKQFDVVVSLETFEHLEDPSLLLSAIQSLRAKNGRVVISCPNDHWYYPQEDQKNPFHCRKYTYEEFFSICERQLGNASYRFIGAPVRGYANFTVDNLLLQQNDQATAIFNYKENVRAVSVPAGEAVTTRNCSYYIGIWDFTDEQKQQGKLQPSTEVAAVFPLTIDINELELLRKNDVAQHNYVNELLALQKEHEVKIATLETKLNQLRQHWLIGRLWQWMGE